MTQLTIVITMAGLGSRFREVGYTVPKYQIQAKGHTLFTWSMESLRGFAELNPSYIFILRKEDQAIPFLEKECANLGIDAPSFIELTDTTDGQATSALLAQEYWEKDSPLLIYNIDTYVAAGQMNHAQLKGDGFLPCFCGEGNHWSFVALDDTGKAVEVREKTRISDHCTLGAYYFSSCGLYEETYRDFFLNNGNSERGERYIAPMYNHLIAQNKPVYISTVAPEYVHPLGTPEELNHFLEN